MRRPVLPAFSIVFAGLLTGCTGTGVFLDHSFKSWGAAPNTPAGSSETFMRVRGESVDVPPLLPETGNVWPTAQGPDPTLQDLEKQQADDIRRNGGQRLPPAGLGMNPANRGVPPGRLPAAPPPPVGSPTVQTPNGPSMDVTGQGSGRGYRQLQSTTPGGSGILVPNGNGTSTLIGPDGSVQTVPTKP